MGSDHGLSGLLKSMRMDLGFSHRDFASYLGVNAATYFRFESKWHSASPRTLDLIIRDWLPKLGLSKDDPKIKEAIRWEIERAIWKEQTRLDQKALYLRKRYGLDK